MAEVEKSYDFTWEMISLEAMAYKMLIGESRTGTEKKYHPWFYSFVANVLSFIIGVWIAKVIPGIF